MQTRAGFRLRGGRVLGGAILTLVVLTSFITDAGAQNGRRQLRYSSSGRVRVFAPTVTCGSGTNNWTGSAGDNQWTTASNWSKGAVPISTDNVCLASTFTKAVTIGTLSSTNQTIASLNSGAPLAMTIGPLTIAGTATFAGDLTVSGGTLTLNGASSMTTLEHTAGTLNGTGTITMSGLLTWSGGTESGTGITNANGGMTMSGEPFLDTRTLNNTGTATWNGAAFLMLNGSVFNNKAGATWNHENDSVIEYDGGTILPTFNNAGTFEKTGGTSSTGGGVATSIIFDNTGTVQANSGILYVQNNGSCSGTCGGTWSALSGATLQLGGPSSGAAALTGGISGAGTVSFTMGTINYTGAYNVTGGTEGSGATVNFTSPAVLTSVGPVTVTSGTLNFSTGKTITTGVLTQSGGTVTGSDTLTVTGLLTWSGGTESGTGITNANGGMTMSGEPFLDTRTLNNTETATWNGAAFLMLNASVFNNKAGATWNHENDSVIEFDGGTTLPTFNNSGTFEKTGGTSSTGGGVATSIIFDNTGTVQANSGILYVQNNGSCSGTCGGTWTVASGATLQLGGPSTGAALSGGISGAGTVSFTTGTINYTGTYNVTGGTQANVGTVNFATPAVLTNVGPLTVTGGTLNFSTGKTITTGSLTQSSGTLTGSDTLTVTGGITWSGGTESGTGITNANGGMTMSGEPFLDTRTINNTKVATWNGVAFLMLNGSVFNNKAGATWNHENDSVIEYDGGTTLPTFANAGTFEKTGGTSASGGGFENSITVTNTGTIISKSGTLLLGNLYTQSGGSTELNGGNISMSGTSTLTENGGNVLGLGTITGGLTNTGGTVSPTFATNSTGTLTINGSGAGYYTQGANGTALLDVGGSGSGQYDVLSIAGQATLAGSAQICLIKGFKPAINSTFPIVTYGSATGSFSTVNFGWSMSYGSTSAIATYLGAPVNSFSPTSLSFASQLIKTTSAPLTETLTNTGQAPLTITSIVLAGVNAKDFSIATNTCGSTLAPGAKCSLTVTFTPSALGTRSASLVYTDNGCASPQMITVTGKGTQITFAPSPVSFGNQTVGTTSAPMAITVTNHGTTAVKVTGTSITGANKSDFTITNNTCTTIAANGGTCTIEITFTPGAKGSRTANLSLTDNDKGSPQTDVLTGTGN